MIITAHYSPSLSEIQNMIDSGKTIEEIKEAITIYYTFSGIHKCDVGA